MKKYLVTSCVYMGLGLAFGVFFREFTKFNDFDGVTALGKMHLHALVLGMLFFLVAALLESKLSIRKSKLEKWFFITYNAGLGIFLTMLLVRGVCHVSGKILTDGASGAISGIAGMGHVALAAGLVLFFIILLKNCKKDENEGQNN